MTDVHTALVSVFREEAGRLTAALVHLLGDFALAEEMVQDALLVALERWPIDGMPGCSRSPGVARSTSTRRDARSRVKLAQLEQPVPRSQMIGCG